MFYFSFEFVRVCGNYLPGCNWVVVTLVLQPCFMLQSSKRHRSESCYFARFKCWFSCSFKLETNLSILLSFATQSSYFLKGISLTSCMYIVFSFFFFFFSCLFVFGVCVFRERGREEYSYVRYLACFSCSVRAGLFL